MTREKFIEKTRITPWIHPDSMPVVVTKDGNEYWGICEALPCGVLITMRNHDAYVLYEEIDFVVMEW